jgi:hypothetical protein
MESVAGTPHPRHPRRRDDEIVAVRIAFDATDLMARAMRLGAVRRPAQKLCEMTWSDTKRLGIADRVVQIDR